MLLFVGLTLMLIDRSHSLSTPVRAAAQPKATSVVEVGTRPIDLILSSGFCAFARQAGNFFCILFTIRKAHPAIRWSRNVTRKQHFSSISIILLLWLLIQEGYSLDKFNCETLYNKNISVTELEETYSNILKNTGVIAAISDFSIPIDRVVGTSSGALAAALFANGYDSFEIATGDL